MNTKEIKEIGKFFGYNVILFKGNEIFDGNEILKTVGDNVSFFGKEMMFTGRFCKDVAKDTNFRFDTDWNLLMFLIDQIKVKNIEEYTLLDKIDDALICIDQKETFKACIQFINFYNKS